MNNSNTNHNQNELNERVSSIYGKYTAHDLANNQDANITIDNNNYKSMPINPNVMTYKRMYNIPIYHGHMNPSDMQNNLVRSNNNTNIKQHQMSAQSNKQMNIDEYQQNYMMMKLNKTNEMDINQMQSSKIPQQNSNQNYNIALQKFAQSNPKDGRFVGNNSYFNMYNNNNTQFYTEKQMNMRNHYNTQFHGDNNKSIINNNNQNNMYIQMTNNQFNEYNGRIEGIKKVESKYEIGKAQIGYSHDGKYFMKMRQPKSNMQMYNYIMKQPQQMNNYNLFSNQFVNQHQNISQKQNQNQNQNQNLQQMQSMQYKQQETIQTSQPQYKLLYNNMMPIQKMPNANISMKQQKPSIMLPSNIHQYKDNSNHSMAKAARQTSIPANTNTVNEDTVETNTVPTQTKMPNNMNLDYKKQNNMKENCTFLHAARKLATNENPLASLSNYTYLYSSFMDWASNSLTCCNSLHEIGYFIFVELWVRLLSVSISDAQKFLDTFISDHYHHHMNELLEMKSITHYDKIRDSSYITRLLRGEKFFIKIDQLTRKLITTKLTYDNDSVLLDILQRRGAIDSSAEIADEYYITRLLNDAIKMVHSKEDNGIITTPSLSHLCGLHSPTFNLKIEDINSFMKTEVDAALFQSSLATEYRLPFANSNHPSIKWRLEAEAQYNYYTYLNRKEVNKDCLPNIIEYKLKLFDINTNEFCTSSNFDLLDNSKVILSKDTSKLAMCDPYSKTVWLYSIATEVWNRNCIKYENLIECKDSNPIRTEIDENDNIKYSDKISRSVICLNGHQKAPTDFVFIPRFITGGKINVGLSTSYDSRVNAWNLDSGRVLYTYNSESPAYSIDVDSFGYQFITGHQDRIAYLWVMDQKFPIRSLLRHQSIVNQVCFHPNSVLIATCCSIESKVRLWDSRIADIIGSVTTNNKFEKCEFSKNGRLLAVYGLTNYITIWDILEGKKFKTIELICTAQSVSFSNNSQLLAVLLQNNSIQLWNMSISSNYVNSNNLSVDKHNDNYTYEHTNNSLNLINVTQQEMNKELVKSLDYQHTLVNLRFTNLNSLVVVSYE